MAVSKIDTSSTHDVFGYSASTPAEPIGEGPTVADNVGLGYVIGNVVTGTGRQTCLAGIARSVW